jgi:glycosyltransferase involved in cell wall biosynthesis
MTSSSLLEPIIDVAIPTIPPRAELLGRAMSSVYAQTQPARRIYVVVDDTHRGAAATRNECLDMVADCVDGPPQFVAYLDDDDIWYPHHLETLYRLHQETGADYLYSWFAGNPALQRTEFARNRGRQFDPQNPHHTTMAIMVAWRIASQIRFRTDHPEGWVLPQEDWRYTLDCVKAGATFAGTPAITWWYNNHGKNTSGLGSRW